MNYFELYPGDYLRDTSRLGLADHGAYLKLMLTYYSEEKPLPADLPSLYQIAAAISAADKAAVRKVVDLFFPIAADGLRHKNRIDEEIAKAQKRIETARRNGAKNQPSKNPAGNPVGTQRDSQPATQQGTRSGEALHAPHATKNQESADADLPPAPPTPRVEPLLTLVPTAARPPCPQEQIVALYHEVLPELRRVREWRGARPKLLSRRWAENPERQSLAWWREFFGYVRQSRFLMGQTIGRDNRPFDCDLEWLIRPTNFAKVVEGKYEDAA